MKPPEEVRRELVGQWIKKAEADLSAAHNLLSHQPLFFYIVAFHCQQAAEKYLKAFLTWSQVEFPKTHDLDELLDLLEKAAPPVALALRPSALLSAYAVEARYPSELPDPTREEAERALYMAEDVRDRVLAALPPTSRF